MFTCLIKTVAQKKTPCYFWVGQQLGVMTHPELGSFKTLTHTFEGITC